jgi:chemotaxis protein histidine kinase CheA
MSQGKPEKPSVVTYADHEVITPPNKLLGALKAVSADHPDDDPVARAEQALERISSEFSNWMEHECERLDRARMEVRTKGLNRTTRGPLFSAAHDIKGQAATFGYPWVGALANSLCRLIDYTPDISRIPTTLIEQHVDAVRAIFRESARPDIATIADKLAKRLREVTDDFLVHENRDRPESLADILAPPVIPDEN